jgi:methylmalonyl-CoA/ethylmalonyl-CoA epimerase
VSDLGGLLARIGPRIFQQGWVVADVGAARDALRAGFGATDFTEFPMTSDYDLRGRTVSCTLSLAFTRRGDMQIELVQPVAGEGIHAEFLERHGSGMHHLGAIVDDLDATVGASVDAGFPAVMSADMGPVRIAYVDTFEALGLYLELIEDPDDMLWATMPWRDQRPSSRTTTAHEGA